MRAIARLMGIMVLACASIGRAADAPATTQSTKHVGISIIDSKTEQPIAGVTLKASVSGASELKSETTTDAAGKASVLLPATDGMYTSIAVRKDGYVPMRLSWNNYRGKKDPVPQKYTLAMVPATTIGGRVLDDTDKPVAGATVVIAARKKLAAPNEFIDVSYVSTKADGDGKWEYTSAPAEFDSIAVGAWHHAYDISRAYFPMEEVKNPATLRDGSARVTLARGETVEGVVYGSDGKPLATASVGVGSDRVASNIIPEIKTDENGRFSFGAKPGERVIVTVKAGGHAPELQQFVMPAEKKTFDVKLGPAKALRGRVVDSDGRPIPGVRLYADTWRGHRTLGASVNTDKDGKFVFKSAPADAILMDIMKAGYADLRNHPLTASDQELTVTLHKPLLVTGVVTNEAGAPVESYRVIKGITFDGKQISWERDRDDNNIAKPRPGGKFEFEETYPYPGYALRIEADGYAPADSRIYKIDEGKVDLAFKLTKAQNLAGVVKRPDGSPAADADVLIATPSSQVMLRNGRMEDHQTSCVRTVTDADGKFSLPPQSEKFILVILHDAGQANITQEDFAKSTDVALQPWGRIEGTLRIGAKLGANETLNIWGSDPHDPNAPRIFRQNEVTADADGKFVFDRVASGQGSVARYVKLGFQTWGGAIHKRFNIKPGETLTLDVGGAGRPVVGRVALPADLPKNWSSHLCQISSKFDQPRPPYPDDWAAMDNEQKKAWFEKWQQSDDGKAYKAKAAAQMEDRRHYSFELKPDGSFRAEDVAPGSYSVRVGVAKMPEDRQCGPGEELGFATSDFTVADIPGGRSDEPLDIGSIPLKLQTNVSVGDVAPAIVTKTIDGKDLKLEDFKGKYVLLDFWATWCGPCVAEMPALKDVYDTFGANPKFAMISLSLDPKAENPKKFAEKNDIRWTQAFLGDWSKATAPADYGVRGIPSVWLIGPDGKVVAKDLRGERIKIELEKVLKN